MLKWAFFSNAHAAGNKLLRNLATLSSGKEIPLKLIYSDPTADIAIFQVDLHDLGLTDDLALSHEPVRIGTNS